MQSDFWLSSLEIQGYDSTNGDYRYRDSHYGIGGRDLRRLSHIPSRLPTNDWIVESLSKISERPRYGLIAPDDYDPVAEKQESLNRVNEVIEQTKRYAQTNKRGMGAIFIGFVFQVAGNGLLLWPYLKELWT